MSLTKAIAIVGLLLALYIIAGCGLPLDSRAISRSKSNGRVSTDNRKMAENKKSMKRDSEDQDGELPSAGVDSADLSNGTTNAAVETPAVFIVSSHKAFVSSLTEKINITCYVNFALVPNNTWKYVEKIVIEHSDVNHEFHPVASVDFMNTVRKSVQDAEVTGEIKRINDSYLTMFYKNSEKLKPGDYRCLVLGYEDDFNAPWMTAHSSEITLPSKEPDIEALVKEIRTDKDEIKVNRHNLGKLDKLLEKFSDYIQYLHNKADLYLEHWPDGLYSLLQTSSGCLPDMPREWNVVDVNICTKTGRMNTDRVPAHFSGERIYDASSSYIRESFCQHDVIGHYPWPAGDYCIHPLNAFTDCPAKFERGTIKMFWEVTLEESVNVDIDLDSTPVKEVIDFENKAGEISMDFCCRNDSSVNTSIALPTQSPFYLYQGQSRNCQVVKGMKCTLEEIRFDTADKGLDIAEGLTPHHALSDVILFLCYYTPENTPPIERPPTSEDDHDDKYDR